MKSWNINPTTGDYLLDGSGRPQETDSLLVPAYIRLTVRRTQWLYAPDTNYGSDFYILKKNKHSSLDGSLGEQTGAKALQPLIDDGRASTVTVTTVVQTRGGIGLQTEITAAGGQPETATFNPIT